MQLPACSDPHPSGLASHACRETAVLVAVALELPVRALSLELVLVGVCGRWLVKLTGLARFLLLVLHFLGVLEVVLVVVVGDQPKAGCLSEVQKSSYRQHQQLSA